MKSIDIEELLRWTIQDQKAWQIIGKGADLHEIEARVAGLEVKTRSQTAIACRIGIQGGFIDGTPVAFGASTDLHPDAEATYEAVMALPKGYRSMVMLYAKLGARPNWHPGARFRAVRAGKDKSKPVYYRRSWKVRYTARWCPVTYINHPDQIIAARKEWRAWHQALVLLVDHLAAPGVLRSHAPTGPAAPAEPWPPGDNAYWSDIVESRAKLRAAINEAFIRGQVRNALASGLTV